ncbi:aldo/keto reductase [Paenibacillus thalictri]|uniref:Aldo/keto reductase n=1 Tax=Paenibacillus thalictri TaxID=2527873 RepID=A0A4Q9DR78_9BACL|nr:aldo/keto reductase [Paenibacillus thalictri]TBL76089.1 aldo/keto reductase [Paenibacillus thalictri]
MEYAEFGKTGVRVSRIGFGGAPAGLTNYLMQYDPHLADNNDRIIEAIDAALEAGINYFDTAPGYGSGKSEELIGYALKGSRDKVFLASKAKLCPPDELRRSLEQSLKRLQTDRLDFFQFHGTSYSDADVRRVREEGILEQMIRLKEEGLVRFIGFTSEDSNRAVYDFIQCGQFDIMQICYNICMQHPYDPNRPFGSILEAEKAGLGIAVMRAFTSGVFQRWMAMVHPDNQFDYTEALIQFVLSNPHVDVALIGMRNADEVRKNVAICDNLSGRVDIGRMFTYY